MTQWDRTISVVRAYYRCEDSLEWLTLADHCDLVRFRRNTRLFRAGDVAVMAYTNGQGERARVLGRSSRGYDVSGPYVQYARYWRRPRWTSLARDRRIPMWQRADSGVGRDYHDRTPIEIIELPGELRGVPVSDPAVRRYVVETLCAGDAATR